MPAPTNISAATATDLGALPHTIVQDISGAAAPDYEVWFKGTATDLDIVWGIWAFSSLTDVYVPSLTVWTGPLGSLTTDLNGTGNVSYTGVNNSPVTIPVNSGQTYYFQVVNSGGTPPGVSLTFSALPAPSLDAPAGSLLVTDDGPDYPICILSSVDGSVLQYLRTANNYGGSDFDGIVPNGRFLIDNPFGPGAHGSEEVRATDFSVVGSVSAPFSIAAICGSQSQTFYIGASNSGGAAKVTTISDAGVLGGTTWTLPGVGLVAIGVSLDETILYYAGVGGSVNAPIQRWDLINNIAMADLVAGVATYTTGHDILVLSDGTILAYYHKGITNDTFVRHYSAAGATLNTYTTADRVDRIAQNNSDDLSFWVWYWTAADNGISDFQQVQVSDGTVLTDIPDIAQYELGIYGAAVLTDDPPRFGTSNSCPLIVTREEILAPVAPSGTIVVVKVNTIVNDATEFDFTATNLTPTTFTLNGIAPDDIATYPGVPVGDGYAITETVPTGWVATYDVSNDSPHTNITVDADETVTVTVTNTFSPPSTGTDEPVRRMRQFTIPSAENFWIFLEKIELEFQRGGGLVTGLGEDPQIMFQLSRDGGKTWGPERWLSAGKLGEYKKRAIWRKMGRARNPVGRIIVSDAVFWALQDLYIDAIKGTS